MFLLDTNVLSELRKGKRANKGVQEWAAKAPAGAFWISVVSVLEVELGVLLVERRDKVQGGHLRAWFEESILQNFAERILPIDIAVARRCAPLHVPDPRAERDAFIAATALIHGLTVVTRDVGDFRATGVPLLNPWTAFV